MKIDQDRETQQRGFMRIWKNAKRFMPSIVLGFIVVTSFQNCQDAKFGLSSGKAGSKTSLPDPFDGILTVIGNQSETAAVDCSRADSFLNWEIFNAESTVSACIEYQLDMPVSSSRYGEKFKCVNQSDFKIVSGVYDYDLESHHFASHRTYTLNHSEYVPGSFTLVVRDGHGGEFRSNPVVLKRPGAVDCRVNTSAGLTCEWVGTDFSPSVGPPKAVCSEANQGQKMTNRNGALYSCICRASH